MKTDELIASLSAQSSRRGVAPGIWLIVLTSLAVVIAGAMLISTIGVRPDFSTALGTWRFDYKFVVTIAVAASALVLVRESLYPEQSRRLPLWVLLAGPVFLALGVVLELVSIPAGAYAMSAVGKNAALCLTVIPSLGIVPLALVLWALRQGAPTRPGLAGVFAGLLAGGIAATFYAANCTDDSPFFVALWYPLAIAILAIAGGIAGRWVIRW